MDHLSFMKMAMEEAVQGMRSGEGGPFGAVIVRDGKVLGTGHNTVLSSKDPTAHAEMNAIRNACRKENSPHLSGAVIYSNFEPCPMCLAAIYWAHIHGLYYAKGRSDAQRIGFMDEDLYKEISLKEDERRLITSQIPMPEMEGIIQEWMGMEGKKLY
jgi:tRNA(Arg) A34 adenosine deaminase TadA